MLSCREIFDRDAFTASTDLQALTPDKYIDKLRLSYKVDMSAGAAVSVANTLALINPIEVRRKGSPVVSIRAADLLALNSCAFGKQPFASIAGAVANNQTKVSGLNVPLALPADTVGSYSVMATRVAVAGCDTETISIDELSSDTALEGKYNHYVEIPITTAAAAGFGNFVELPQPGDLYGILFFSETIPTVTTETATMQEVRIAVNKRQEYEAEWHNIKADGAALANNALFSSPADASIMDNYAYLDFSKDPIPADASVRLDINGGVVAEAVRIIPLYKV